MNLVFVLISCFLIINIEATNHPLTELDKMFCMYQYRAEIKQLRRFPGKQDVRAEAYDVNYSTSNLFILTNLILTKFILTNPILANFILTNLILTKFILTNLILTNFILTNLILTNFILTNLILTNVIILRLVQMHIYVIHTVGCGMA